MIRSLIYHQKTQSIIEGDATAIEQWRADPDTIIWVDIQDESEQDERKLLLETFGLHPLAVQDALRQRHPPKIEAFDDNLFILLRGLDKDTRDINFGVIQLALFVGDRFFVTRHNKDSISADAVWDAVKNEANHHAFACDKLALRLINRVVRRFIDVLLNLEPRLDELETEVFANPKDALLAELTRYKSQLRQLQRIANYHLQIAATLQSHRPEQISAEQKHEIIDIYEQLERSLSLALLYYEIAKDLTDGYLAAASHRLNNVMQILTIFTVTFVPLTFLAGNLRHELRQHAGTPHALRLFRRDRIDGRHRHCANILFPPQTMDLKSVISRALIGACLIFAAGAFAYAQNVDGEAEAEAPSISELPADWWRFVEDSPEDQRGARLDELAAAVSEAAAAAGADDTRAMADDIVADIDAYRLLLERTPPEAEQPLPAAADAYTFDELIAAA